MGKKLKWKNTVWNYMCVVVRLLQTCFFFWKYKTVEFPKLIFFQISISPFLRSIFCCWNRNIIYLSMYMYFLSLLSTAIPSQTNLNNCKIGSTTFIAKIVISDWSGLNFRALRKNRLEGRLVVVPTITYTKKPKQKGENLFWIIFPSFVVSISEQNGCCYFCTNFNIISVKSRRNQTIWF